MNIIYKKRSSLKQEKFIDLFTDSTSSGKLINFSLTDFGKKIKKAKLSFGNVPLGIYRQGSKKRNLLIFHDKENEKEIHQLFTNLAQKGNFYSSLRNFQQKVLMNFTQEDFKRGLYLTTFTFNNYQNSLPFSFSPWNKKKGECFLVDSKGGSCVGKHFYQTVSIATSSFLAEKKTAKKMLGRELEGVNDLFTQSIQLIQKLWKPTNFKWVAVPELHKCQTLCHWQGKKHRKSSWKNHSEKHCLCKENHQCHRNWHIHMLSTDYLFSQYTHQQCGLGKYNERGNRQGCWDHQAYIAHDIWPHGLADIKRVSHYKVSGGSIKTSEEVVHYLVKYLAKSFQMRTNKELAEKVGLLPGMKIYKFFRIIYDYYGDSIHPREKIKKPSTNSYIFINNNHEYSEQDKKDLIASFMDDLKSKENTKKTLYKKERKNLSCRQKGNRQITDVLKLCLRFASHSSVKKSYYWKTCETKEDPIWKKGEGWKVRCPITQEHHLEPIVRWNFEFNDYSSYTSLQASILPSLQSLNLPRFHKFQDYQVSQKDYTKFAIQASLPWNKEINEYLPLEEIGETANDKKWQKNVPSKLIYNYVYLKEIRSQISLTNHSWELSASDARKRYADY